MIFSDCAGLLKFRPVECQRKSEDWGGGIFCKKSADFLVLRCLRLRTITKYHQLSPLP